MEPSGSGEHVLMRVEKSGIDTLTAIDRLSRELGVPRAEFGRAGLKDARAETVQLLTVRGVPPERVQGLELDSLRVPFAAAHDRKLRPGALRGNRFRLRLRPVAGRGLRPAAEHRAGVAFEGLVAEGLVNRFGPQRLGPRQRTARAGLALWRGAHGEALALLLGCPLESDAESVRAARTAFEAGDLEACLRSWPRSHRNESELARRFGSKRDARGALARFPREPGRLLIQAAQSLLFEKLVDQRGPTPGRPWPGDVVRRAGGGGAHLFDPATEEAGEDRPIPLLPLFGRKLHPATDRARDLERAMLSSFGLSEELLRARRESGTRRPAVVPIEAEAPPTRITDELGEGLELRFSLPPGSYATVVLAQFAERLGPITEPRAAPHSDQPSSTSRHGPP